MEPLMSDTPRVRSFQKNRYRICYRIWCEVDERWCNATPRPSPGRAPVLLGLDLGVEDEAAEQELVADEAAGQQHLCLYPIDTSQHS